VLSGILSGSTPPTSTPSCAVVAPSGGSGGGGSCDAVSPTGHSLPTMAMPSTSLVVERCDAANSGLSAHQVNALMSRGFTKCCFGAFSVLVAGSNDYPDAYVLTACVTVAELLDQNQDGVADDLAVVASLSYRSAGTNAPVLQGATTQAGESCGDGLGGDGFAYGFSLQTWHCNGGGCPGGANDARATITEEVFHMITEYGYSRVHPAAMGMLDFTSSIACRTMAAASCVTWMHPENTCPTPGTHTQPPLQGTCTGAGCDCVEWFHQAVLILAGQPPGWYGVNMPTTAAALRATLDGAFLAMVADPQYALPQSPLTYTYNPPSSSGATGPSSCREIKAAYDGSACCAGTELHSTSYTVTTRSSQTSSTMATCLDLKQAYQSSVCCGNTPDQQTLYAVYQPASTSG